MAYKFQLGAATMSGSLLQEGNLELSSGNSFIIGSAAMSEADLEKLDGITNGAAAANKAAVLNADLDFSGGRNLTISGELDAGSLDVSGDIDVDGTANLDAVDIDGNVQLDGTFSVGVNDTGYDVKFFGASGGAYMLWDESEDDLILGGAARAVIPDGNLVLNATAVSSTAAELNKLDGADVNVTAAKLNTLSALSNDEIGYLDGAPSNGAAVASKALVVDSNRKVSNIAELTASVISASSLHVAASSIVVGGVTISASEIQLIDGVTAGTVIASRVASVDANKDMSGGRNLTISGELDAASLDISGDADIDGTLEADAYTVAGVALDEQVQDWAGAMFSSNTETGGALTYQDADGTIDFAIAAAQTTITSVFATDLKIGEDDQTKIDFETNDQIHFYAANAEQVYVADGIFGPETDSDVDLGSTGVRFKNAYIDSLTSTGAGDFGGALSCATSLTIGSAVMSEADLEKLDGITNGAGLANKALVLDDNADIASGLRNITMAGNLSAVDITGTGNITLGNNAAADSIALSGSLIWDILPKYSKEYDIGSASKKFSSVYAKDFRGEMIDNSVADHDMPSAALSASVNIIVGGAMTVLLPAADKGKRVTVKRGIASSGTVRVSCSSGALLDEHEGFNHVDLESAGAALTFISTNTSPPIWIII